MKLLRDNMNLNSKLLATLFTLFITLGIAGSAAAVSSAQNAAVTPEYTQQGSTAEYSFVVDLQGMDDNSAFTDTLTIQPGFDVTSYDDVNVENPSNGQAQILTGNIIVEPDGKDFQDGTVRVDLTGVDVPSEGTYTADFSIEDNNNEGNTASDTAEFYSDGTAPSSPPNFEVEAQANGEIQVNWDDVDESGAEQSGVKEYKLMRKSGSSSFTVVETIEDDGSSSYGYTDTDTNDDQTYSYKVEVVDEVGNEAETSQKSATADSTSPTADTIEARFGKEEVTLTFSEPVYANDDETGSLGTGDFSYNDQSSGNGATAISSVSHTAGTKEVVITLDTSVTGDDLNTDQIEVLAGSVYDSVGNDNQAQSLTLQDNEKPELTSVGFSGFTDGVVSDTDLGDPVDVKLEFSEPIDSISTVEITGLDSTYDITSSGSFSSDFETWNGQVVFNDDNEEIIAGIEVIDFSDKAGNTDSDTSFSSVLSVDTENPQPVIESPSDGDIIGETVTLESSETTGDTIDSTTWEYNTGSGWNTISDADPNTAGVQLDTTTITGSQLNNVDLRLTMVDDADNQGTDSIQVDVDNEPPTVASSEIQVNDIQNDGKSSVLNPLDVVWVEWDDSNTDVQSVDVDFSEFGGSSMSATKGSLPSSCPSSISSSEVESGKWYACYEIQNSDNSGVSAVDRTDAAVKVTATDKAGLQGTADKGSESVDNILPEVSADSVPQFLRGSVGVDTFFTSSSSDGESLDYDWRQPGASAWNDIGSLPWDTTVSAVPDGDVELRAVVTDDSGNTDTATGSTTVDNIDPLVDTISPQVTSKQDNLVVETPYSQVGPSGLDLDQTTVTVQHVNAAKFIDQEDIAGGNDFLTYDQNNQVLEIEFGGKDYAQGTWNIDIDSQDNAGNNPAVQNFELIVDSEAPQLTDVKKKSVTEFTFDVSDERKEAFAGIDASTVEPSDFEITNPSSASATFSKSGCSDGVKNCEIKAVLNNPVDQDEVTATLTGEVSDLAGNKLSKGEVSVTEMDGVGPTLESGETVSDTEIELELSEDLADGTVDASDFNVDDNDVETADEVSTELVSLKLGDPLKTGETPDVTLTSGSGSVEDLAGNQAPTPQTVTPADGLAPEAVRAVTDDSDGDGYIDEVSVLFSEPVEKADTDPLADDFSVKGYSIKGGTLTQGIVGLNGNDDPDTGYEVVLELKEGSSYDTGAEPEVTVDAGAVEDPTENPSVAAALNAEDGAAPLLLHSEINNEQSSSSTTRVDLTFSEEVTDLPDARATFKNYPGELRFDEDLFNREKQLTGTYHRDSSEAVLDSGEEPVIDSFERLGEFNRFEDAGADFTDYSSDLETERSESTDVKSYRESFTMPSDPIVVDADGDATKSGVYNSLSTAITDAKSGDTIKVMEGTYSESDRVGVPVDDLNIVAAKGASPRVEVKSSSNQRAIDVRGSDVRIQGLKVRAPSDSVGISIAGDNAYIADNTVDSGLTGIQATSGATGTANIIGNKITGTEVGVSLISTGNELVGNEITTVSTEGVGVTGGTSQTIRGNTIEPGTGVPDVRYYIENADSINGRSGGEEVIAAATIDYNTMEEVVFKYSGNTYDSSIRNVNQNTLQHSLQDAVDDAAPGDTVAVAPGDYDEKVVSMTKPLTLESTEGPGETRINGRVELTAEDSTLKGFKISPPQTFTPEDAPASAVFATASDVLIGYNHISGVRADAAATGSSMSAHGIQLFKQDGIPAEDLTVRNNLIENLQVDGTDSWPNYGGGVGIKVQNRLEDVEVTGNTIRDIQSAGWAYGVVSTPSSDDSMQPQDVEVRSNRITEINTGYDQEYPGVGLGLDTAGGSPLEKPPAADASEVTASANSIVAPVDVQNKDQSENLSALGNWFGTNGAQTEGPVKTSYVRLEPSSNGVDVDTFRMKLTEGINTVSFPIVQGSVPADELLSDKIKDKVDVIWKYDSEDGEWVTVYNDQSETYGEFRGGVGYYFKMEKETTLNPNVNHEFDTETFSGDLPAVPSLYELTGSWNLVGSFQEYHEEASGALQSVSTEYDTVLGLPTYSGDGREGAYAEVRTGDSFWLTKGDDDGYTPGDEVNRFDVNKEEEIPWYLRT